MADEDNEPKKCGRCGGDHELIGCQYVKAIEYGGTFGDRITRIEFLTPADWHRTKDGSAVDESADVYPKLGQKPEA